MASRLALLACLGNTESPPGGSLSLTPRDICECCFFALCTHILNCTLFSLICISYYVDLLDSCLQSIVHKGQKRQ